MLGIGFAITLGLLAFQIAQPWPLKWIFDAFAHGETRGFASTTDAMLAFTGAWLVLAVGAAVSEYFQLLVLSGLGNRVLRGFRDTLYQHLLAQSLEFHEKREVGELLTRVVSDTSRLRRGLNTFLLKSAHTVLTFLATFAILLWLNPSLALVAAATGLLGFLLMAGTGRRIVRAAKKQRAREGRVAAIVEEGLSAIREHQTWRTGEPLDPRFARSNQKSFKEEQKVRRMEASLFLRMNLLLGASVCAVLWLGSAQAAAGAISAGDLVLFMTYMLSLYKPFGNFAQQSARTGRLLACSDRLVKILEKEPSIRDLEGSAPAPRLAGGVAFENVTVRLRNRSGAKRRRVLSRVSFKIEPGERVAIVGPNGAGKSTLLRLLPRLVDPRSGRVVIDGQDVRDFTLASLRSQISTVHQEPVLFGLTIRENIALASPGLTPEKFDAVLTRAEAAGIVKKLEQKAETVVRRRGRGFSVGERQRLAVARALARDGSMWLLDEPTAGLDASATADLTRLLHEVTQGRTTFWITHDPATARSLDRILLLVKGKLRYSGPPAGLGAWLESALPAVTKASLRRYYEQLKAAA